MCRALSVPHCALQLAGLDKATKARRQSAPGSWPAPQKGTESALSTIKDLSLKTEVLLSASAEQQVVEQAVVAEVVGELIRKLLAQVSACGEALRKVAVRLLESDVPAKLLSCLKLLDFESRKAAAHIICLLIRALGNIRDHVTEFVWSAPTLVKGILDCCVQEETFFLGCEIVRSAATCPKLAVVLLDGDSLLKLLDCCFHPNFEISNEVFASVRELLLKQKGLAAESVDANFEAFFKSYNSLLELEEDFVIQRQATKLLGQMLLDPEYQDVMMRYVQNVEFLKILMNLLRDASQTLPVDAFHIFKLFVAQPCKPPAVRGTLHRNSQRLVRLLCTFERRRLDEGCRADLQAVVEMLRSM